MLVRIKAGLPLTLMPTHRERGGGLDGSGGVREKQPRLQFVPGVSSECNKDRHRAFLSACDAQYGSYEVLQFECQCDFEFLIPVELAIAAGGAVSLGRGRSKEGGVAHWWQKPGWTIKPRPPDPHTHEHMHEHRRPAAQVPGRPRVDGNFPKSPALQVQPGAGCPMPARPTPD